MREKDKKGKKGEREKVKIVCGEKEEKNLMSEGEAGIVEPKFFFLRGLLCHEKLVIARIKKKKKRTK